MAKDEKLADQGFEREKWKKLQTLTTELAAWQDQAMQLACPNCQGKLTRNDIGSVRCTSCNNIYHCQVLVESCGLKLDS